MVITLTLEFSIKIGRQPKFLKLLNSAFIDARAFDGCIRVESLAETDGTTLFLLEQWETRSQQATYS